MLGAQFFSMVVRILKVKRITIFVAHLTGIAVLDRISVAPAINIVGWAGGEYITNVRYVIVHLSNVCAVEIWGARRKSLQSIWLRKTGRWVLNNALRGLKPSPARI